MPGWSVANEGSLTVALDITITEELRAEGVAREIVKRIQTYRKESGFEITDRILITLQNHPSIIRAVDEYKDFICMQVLCEDLTLTSNVSSDSTFELDGAQIHFQIRKV